MENRKARKSFLLRYAVAYLVLFAGLTVIYLVRTVQVTAAIADAWWQALLLCAIYDGFSTYSRYVVQRTARDKAVATGLKQLPRLLLYIIRFPALYLLNLLLLLMPVKREDAEEMEEEE